MCGQFSTVASLAEDDNETIEHVQYSKVWLRNELTSQSAEQLKNINSSLQQTLVCEFSKRDIAINDNRDKLNTHNNEIAELRTEISQVKCELQEVKDKASKKTEERKIVTRDNVIIVDGFAENETSETDLADKMIALLNGKLAGIIKTLQPSDVPVVTRVGQSRANARRVRSVRVVFHSDWTKRDIMANRGKRRGSDIYLNEDMSPELKTVEYYARLAYKAKKVPKFNSRKDHLQFVPGPGYVPVKVYDKAGLDEFMGNDAGMMGMGGGAARGGAGGAGSAGEVPMQVSGSNNTGTTDRGPIPQQNAQQVSKNVNLGTGVAGGFPNFQTAMSGQIPILPYPQAYAMYNMMMNFMGGMVPNWMSGGVPPPGINVTQPQTTTAKS